MPTVELSEEQKQELVAMLERGVPVAQVRKEFGGLTAKRVELIVEEMNAPKIKTRAQRAEEVDKKLVEIKAFAKYQSGYSAAKLATMAGTSPAYVKKWLDHKRISEY